MAINPTKFVQTENGAKIKLKVSFIFLALGGRSSKTNLKQNEFSVYSKTDRFQLLTIASSQEQEKRNKMMAQAEAPRLKLSRSTGKKDESITLQFLLYSLRHC